MRGCQESDACVGERRKNIAKEKPMKLSAICAAGVVIDANIIRAQQQAVSYTDVKSLAFPALIRSRFSRRNSPASYGLNALKCAALLLLLKYIGM
jgi:hypothetical protein